MPQGHGSESGAACNLAFYQDSNNRLGWLVQTQTVWHGPSSSGLLSENDYTYDAVGNRQTNQITTAQTNAGGVRQFSGGTPLTATRTETYGYDELSRLTDVDYGDGQTQSYGFDNMGNRYGRQDSAAGTTYSAHDAANRLTATTGTGASTYTNDADGNTLTGGGRTSVWDSQNRLVSCTKNGVTSTYTYGADGLRRSSTVTSTVNGVTTYYVYDGQSMVQEMKRSATTQALYPTATYLTGPRGPECRIDETNQTEGYYLPGYTGVNGQWVNPNGSQPLARGKTIWYVYDGLSSVVGEVDASGNLTSSPQYDVYGTVRSNSGSASSQHGFVGSLLTKRKIRFVGTLGEVRLLRLSCQPLVWVKHRYVRPANPARSELLGAEPRVPGLSTAPEWSRKRDGHGKGMVTEISLAPPPASPQHLAHQHAPAARRAHKPALGSGRSGRASAQAYPSNTRARRERQHISPRRATGR